LARVKVRFAGGRVGYAERDAPRGMHVAVKVGFWHQVLKAAAPSCTILLGVAGGESAGRKPEQPYGRKLRRTEPEPLFS